MERQPYSEPSQTTTGTEADCVAIRRALEERNDELQRELDSMTVRTLQNMRTAILGFTKANAAPSRSEE